MAGFFLSACHWLSCYSGINDKMPVKFSASKSKAKIFSVVLHRLVQKIQVDFKVLLQNSGFSFGMSWIRFRQS